MDKPNQRLWQLVAEFEAKLNGDTQAVVTAVQDELARQGFQNAGISQQIISEYVAAFRSGLTESIQQATSTGVAAGVPARDKLVSRLAAEAFTEQWADGKNLSTRIWSFEQDSIQGFKRILAEGINAGKAANGLIYDMQREIERTGGKFDLAATNLEDWAAELTDWARSGVKDQVSRQMYRKLYAEALKHAETLKEGGTQHAARTFLKKLDAAFKKGNDDLIQEAVRWWWYDKQLYQLKRIARTEIATAQHRAVIASTVEDEDVIGYQWRLSSSHDVPDICDFYANIEMGLGKGVWVKDAVPKHKAHPNCMCSITPRVTKVKGSGSQSYADFILGLPPEKRSAFLPKWSRDLMKQGTPLADLMRPDGLGLIANPSA